MITLKRILFPTDFSPQADKAREYAYSLAEKFDAELHIVCVVQDVALMAPEMPGTFAMPITNLDEVVKAAEQSLHRYPACAGKAPVRVVRTGEPFVEIIRYAKERNIDLIVLGTHGRTGLTHVLLGSVAERVVRKAGCPVLTVRPEGHQFVMP
ncbi:MAG: universal stress protein [Planctomycetaceae bacterium]